MFKKEYDVKKSGTGAMSMAKNEVRLMGRGGVYWGGFSREGEQSFG